MKVSRLASTIRTNCFPPRRKLRNFNSLYNREKRDGVEFLENSETSFSANYLPFSNLYAGISARHLFFSNRMIFRAYLPREYSRLARAHTEQEEHKTKWKSKADPKSSLYTG